MLTRWPYSFPSVFVPDFPLFLTFFFFYFAVSPGKPTLGFHSLCGDRARGARQLRPPRGQAGRHHRRRRQQQGMCV